MRKIVQKWGIIQTRTHAKFKMGYITKMWGNLYMGDSGFSNEDLNVHRWGLRFAHEKLNQNSTSFD